MKRLLAAFAACALTSASFGITWTDRDPDSGNGPLDFLFEDYWWSDGDLHFQSAFNIGLDGFIPALHAISSISVKFAFADDDQRLDRHIQEHVDIYVGGIKLWNNEQVDGDHTNAPWSFDWLAMGLDPAAHAAIFDDLSEDGLVSYKVVIQDLEEDIWLGADREDTFLKIAKLKAEGHRVPDTGSSLALLGLGLTGLACLRGHRR